MPLHTVLLIVLLIVIANGFSPDRGRSVSISLILIAVILIALTLE